jgi:hypothetical protein
MTIVRRVVIDVIVQLDVDGNTGTMDDWLRKMRLAVNVLLNEAGEIGDGLEAICTPSATGWT